MIKDIQNCCAGAKFLPDMKIQFDSQGGANMLTSQADINAWIERVKKAILSGGKAYEIQNTSENR
ncbi:hypothetical protein [Butyrivibrio sp. NC2002]|uniref:hypothetical protein n=1 Tax=Butyrivibrio sp. NC2002 TaxID=1410610 RepID=UPI0018CC2AEB|nr:hypothetical protein [Butyrivibrio sp. NC2002]